MRTAFLNILFFVAAVPAAAGVEPWEFVYVARSTSLETHQGTALLERSGNSLEGKLRDTKTGEYTIKLKLRGKSVTGWFGALESDDGGTTLNGRLDEFTFPAPDGTECWQTIQLFDGSHSVTLARNLERCGP